MYNHKAPFTPICGCYWLDQVVIVIVSNIPCIFSEIITLFNIASTMRFSKEKAHKHRSGIQLIESCKAVRLLIINGRVGQDNGNGDFTRVDTTERGTVNYMIWNPELLSIVHGFMIEPTFSESEHYGLSIKIHCKSRSTSNDEIFNSDWVSVKNIDCQIMTFYIRIMLWMMPFPSNIARNLWLLCRNLNALTWLQSFLARTSYKQWTVSAQAQQ